MRLRRDFTNEKGVVDWNHFRDFTVDVTGKDGTDPDESGTNTLTRLALSTATLALLVPLSIGP